MAFRRLSEKQNQLYSFIDELLWQEWDPIGVNDTTDARDEYQSYTPKLFSLAIRGATVDEIAQELFQIETYRIGVLGNRQSCRLIAQKIVERVKENTRLT